LISHPKSRPHAIGRRRLLAGAGAVAAAGVLGFPRILRGRAAEPVRIGLVHPVSGFLAFSGNQCRLGAMTAIADSNAAGGIRSLGGAPVTPLLGDAQSRPDVGSAEVEKMNESGVSAIVGAYASSISLSTTQRAARHGIPHVVDVGVADRIVNRGLENTFRFAPGYGTITAAAMDNLVGINAAAGHPARTAMIVHEESLFGTGIARLLSRELPSRGFEVLDTIRHANPTRDFSNIVLKIRARAPDLIISASYYDEYALFTRTFNQYQVSAKAIYSVLGGAASSYKFLAEFPNLAQHIIDCNHWYDPRSETARALRRRIERQGHYFTYEVFLAYEATRFLLDAIERAGRRDRAAVIAALAASRWDDHFMPYGPTRMVDGQNTGARPLTTQILGDSIEVIHPPEYATAEPVFPVPDHA